MPAIKKQGKFKKVIGFFNPSTKRGGMALFMLTFAVIGGGYMAYKSFAATTLIGLNADQIKGWGDARRVTETETEKKNMPVWSLPMNSGVNGFFKTTGIKSGYYKFCFIARLSVNAGGPVKYSIGSLVTSGSGAGGEDIEASLSSTYTKTCTREYIDGKFYGYSLSVENGGNTYPVKVSLMTIEY